MMSLEAQAKCWIEETRLVVVTVHSDQRIAGSHVEL